MESRAADRSVHWCIFNGHAGGKPSGKENQQRAAMCTPRLVQLLTSSIGSTPSLTANETSLDGLSANPPAGNKAPHLASIRPVVKRQIEKAKFLPKCG